MGDLAKLTIWEDPSIRSALSWYLDVAENRRPAKFRIGGTVIAAGGGGTEPVGAVPRTCLPHARPLQFLSVELPSRPRDRRQVRRLQACLRFAGQLAFPSYRGGAVLSRHARLGHDLFHLVQHAVRLLPEWGHQH